MSEGQVICPYCGNVSVSDPCTYCGGSTKDDVPQKKERKSGPYFYNGYMVWPAYVDDFEMVLRYYWYLGDRLVRVIQFPRTFLMRIEGTDNFRFDIRAFVWRLFQVAQGEEEVLVVEEKHDWRQASIPATFEIRRVEPEKITEEEAEQYWIERYQ